MATPSEKYVVDSTIQYGTTTVNLTKDLSTLYPTLNEQIDNSISINRLEDELVKNIYAKSTSYNPIYDDSITFTVEPDAPEWVWKYYKRSAYPNDTVLINNAIVYGIGDSRVYAIGIKEDAAGIYDANSAGDLQFIRDIAYNNILFECYATEYNDFTLLPKGTIQEGISDHPVPTMTQVELGEVDADKWYLGFNHRQAHIWDGSGWSSINAMPIMICNGETVQTVQGAGKSFYSSYNQYSTSVRTGQNISISVSSNNHLNFGYNYHNRMEKSEFTLGWNNSINTAPNWTDIPAQIINTITQWFIDNNIPTGSGYKHWFLISSEIKTVSDNMGMLVTVIGQFYLTNASTIHCSDINEMFYPMVKGSTILKMLAGFGCYYLSDPSADLTGITPDNLDECSDIWLGEMNSDGTTSGNWIKGADIDSYDGYNKDGNTVNPSFDPSGGGGVSDDDDIDALTFGSYSGGAGAFANVWYTTAAELGNLKTWMNKAPGAGGPPAGYNPMDSILSLMIYPIEIPTQGSLVNISFFNANDADNHLISSDAQGYFTEGKTFEIDLGSYTISPKHDKDWAYIDYDTAVELYIPFCGVYQVDTQVIMGTTLSAKMWVDPVMGSCTFCAYANNIPVAMGSGSLGVSLPVASQQFSMVQAAITTNRNSFIASAIGTTIGTIASVVTGGLSGSAAAVNKTWGSAQLARGVSQRPLGAQAVSAVRSAGFREGIRDSLNGSVGASVSAGMIGKATGNVYNVFRTNKMLAAGNSTAVSGGFGGSQDPWRLPMTPYVKILRERTHVSDMHVGTTGKLYVMSAKLKDLSGFTTVVNPDLSSLTNILTQSELAEIYTTLTNGVYC